MRSVWRPKPGDVVVRRPRLAELKPIILRLPIPHPPPRGIASPLTLIYGFALLITLGTVLLMLPLASRDGQMTPIVDALFTAVSAVSATGLTVLDTPTHWSAFGQAVIFASFLVGGMGWMTVAGFILMILGQRITLAQRMALREPLGMTQLGGIVRLIRNMVITFLSIQALAAGAMAFRFHSGFEVPWGEAVWQGVFHAVSGFNNAGFSIFPTGFSALHEEYVVLGIMAVLIALGGLSFLVMADLVRTRRIARFSLDTKIVLTATLALWFLGALVFFAFEFGNAATLGHLPLGEKLFAALFHSISARTAGFSTVSLEGMAQATGFFIIALMFIGTASASAGGGIRVNTLGVLVATVLASVRGKEQVSLFQREIPQEVVHRALALAFLGLLMVFFMAFFLTFTEKQPFLKLFFEAVSAFGTVGLSTGITPELHVTGKLVLVLTMLVGRLGPLTLALALVPRERPALYRYARERVRIA